MLLPQAAPDVEPPPLGTIDGRTEGGTPEASPLALSPTTLGAPMSIARKAEPGEALADAAEPQIALSSEVVPAVNPGESREWFPRSPETVPTITPAESRVQRRTSAELAPMAPGAIAGVPGLGAPEAPVVSPFPSVGLPPPTQEAGVDAPGAFEALPASPQIGEAPGAFEPLQAPQIATETPDALAALPEPTETTPLSTPRARREDLALDLQAAEPALRDVAVPLPVPSPLSIPSEEPATLSAPSVEAEGLVRPEPQAVPLSTPAPARPAALDETASAEAQQAALLAYVDSILLGTPPPRLPQWLQPPSAQAAAGAPPALGEEEPTFHVTIGQLEIVGPPRAPIPTRRPPSGPRLSLQAYLEKRRAGRS